MKIEFQDKEHSTFEKIKPGELFSIDDNLYIKISEYHGCNAIYLYNGSTSVYEEDFQVKGPLNHKLIIF